MTAVAGPTCPVETVPTRPGCAPRPVPNVTVLVMDADGAVREKVILDAAGQRSSGLPPGAYVGQRRGRRRFHERRPEAQRVDRGRRRITEVTLAFDTVRIR